MPEDKLGELLAKMVATIAEGSLTKAEANFHGMKITAYSMGPGMIRIDIKE